MRRRYPVVAIYAILQYSSARHRGRLVDGRQQADGWRWAAVVTGGAGCTQAEKDSSGTSGVIGVGRWGVHVGVLAEIPQVELVELSTLIQAYSVAGGDLQHHWSDGLPRSSWRGRCGQCCELRPTLEVLVNS
jgi:hypothetical protein